MNKEDAFQRKLIEDSIRQVGPRMTQVMLRELGYDEDAASIPQIAKEMGLPPISTPGSATA